MPHASFWRGLLAGALTSMVALSSVVAVSPASALAAGTPMLTISEVSWTGLSESDEWVELVNTSGASLDLSTQTFSLRFGMLPTDPTVIVGGAGAPIVASGDSIVVRNAGATVLDTANPLLATFIPVAPLPAFDDASMHLQVLDVADVLVDEAHVSRPAPSGVATPSSERLVLATSGTTDTNWAPARVIGANYVAGTTTVLGTPGAERAVIVAPATVSISPVANAVVADELALATVSVTMQVDPSVQVVAIRVRNLDTMVATSDIGTPITPDYTTDLTLSPGRYQFSMILSDASGNLLPEVSLPVVGALDGAFVVTPTTSTVLAPVVSTVVSPTKNGTVLLSGSTPFGVTYDTVVVVKNGLLHAALTPAIDGTFTTTLPLTDNSTNTFAIYGVVGGVYSAASSLVVVQDGVALPLTDPTTKVQANAPGLLDTISGVAGAAEPGALVQVAADLGFTSIIGSATVKADGSFGPISIGNNLYSSVFARQTDVLGNVSTVTSFTNTVAFVLPAGFTLTQGATSQSEVTISWPAVGGASGYELFVRLADGSYGTARVLCTTATVCQTTATVLGLTSDTGYVFGVVAIDAAGNRTAIRELAVRTAAANVAPVVTDVAVLQTSVVEEAPKTVASTRVIPSPTPAPVVSAEPTTTPETGEVQSATTVAATNWAPWIILAIILVVALAAALGYFYWFGGEAGEAAMLAAAKRSKEDQSSQAKSETTKKSGTPPDKRW